jgi:hypothetical protein
MKEFRLLFLAHLILGPVAVIIIADDMSHPERLESWYCNPAFFFPYLIAIEVFIWGTMAYLRHYRLKQDRLAKGTWMLQEANRLLAEGRLAEADAAYRKGVEMAGIKRNGG